MQERILALTKTTPAAEFLDVFSGYFLRTLQTASGLGDTRSDVEPVTCICVYAKRFDGNEDPFDEAMTWQEIVDEHEKSKGLITNFRLTPNEAQASLKMSLVAHQT